MKILIGHNYYQQPGGEDAVAQSEVDMLRQHGHVVEFVEFYNQHFNDLSAISKIQNVISWDWSQNAYEFIRDRCRVFKPDIAHFHNTFFMMTPSVYFACKAEGVPIVQTLHNFRLLCSNGIFFRQGQVCQECVSHSLNRGIKYGCYRHSRILTWGVVNMLEKHRARGTWQEEIDLFIALTDFSRARFIEGGLPGEKIFVKPNSIKSDPGARAGMGDYFVYAGRLSEEKGIAVLLEAFKFLPDQKLIIMGEGPLRVLCEDYIKKGGLQNIRIVGHIDKKDYYEILKKAKALILPSIWYENFPVVIIEAFACGVPVIASRLGSIEQIIVDDLTGLLFNPGDHQDLIQKVRMLSQNNSRAFVWGKEARRTFESKFSSEINYQELVSLYEKVKKNKRI